jgi:hypothetical protein
MRLTDELGFSKSLFPGHETVRTCASREWLVLGLGPDPAALAESLPPDAEVFYLECPSFYDQTDGDWRAAIPPGWRRVESFDPLKDRNIILYEAGMQLFPGFWGPVTAALALPCPAGQTGGKAVLVPTEKSRLIASEVSQALVAEGFQVLPVAPGDLLPILETSRPDLFLSINFAGLDPFGAASSVLARAGVPVAVWCVDNPFHSLSALKSHFWQDVHLFVTDDWFVAPLKGHGAKHVHHLPLAANQDFFKAAPDRPELADKLLFVGRSAFPDKAAFFAGLKLPDDALALALAMLERGDRPDFAWWSERLGVERLWPGKDVRLAGLGAEESGRAWRAQVLAEAAKAGELVVHGDGAWRTLVPSAFDLRAPVDYYGPLAGMYASARCVIGATSPLLPRGLTQRHFDVWAAGGCLISDDTPGLDLFPAELTRPITFHTPSSIPAALASLERNRMDLIRAWRELVSREHTYAHRIQSILEHISP